MSTRIQVSHLSAYYGAFRAVEDVSLTIEPRTITAFIGPSGCGKSTILRILIGLTEPSAGRVFKNGVDITDYPPAKRKMGIVFQNYALFENMTVLGNVEYALKMDKTKKADSRRIALELIERVGLSEHLNKRPYKLSGGQQQRVAIARTLAVNPDVILLDEPMSALDADMRLSLRHELKSIQREFGSTMVYITHDQEEALAMSDRIIVMDAGVIRQLDTPQNIVEHPADDYVQSFVLDNMKLKMVSLAGFNIA